MKKIAPTLVLLSLAVAAIASGSTTQRPRLVDRINRTLSLSSDQREKVDPIVEIHVQGIQGIRKDPTLGKSQRQKAIKTEIQAMIQESQPYLNSDQIEDFNALFEDILRPGLHAKIAVEYSDYFPTSGEARSIFGRSLGSYGVGLGGDELIGQRARLGFSFDLFEMASYGNKLFVLSPQANYEYRIPIRRRLYAFTDAAVGPSYMDYSYDTPDGDHSAGKNFGLDGSLGVGLQWGPLRLGVEYRAFTQPSGLSFDGFEATISFTVFRF